MTKKKNSRQKHHKAVSFADTSDEELNVNVQGKICQHVARGIHFGRVKKSLKSCQSILMCNGCPDESTEDQPEVWLCLQCGYRGCGRTSENKHGLQHFKTLHSDCHSLVLSTSSGAVWCYDCDDEISIQSSHNLKQCVEFVMKAAPAKLIFPNKTNISGVNKAVTEQSLQTSVIKEETSGQNLEQSDPAGKIQKTVKIVKESSQKSVIKGLRNLGNTCFFNAVMQNLNQTTLLHHQLKNTCNPSHLWEVPELIFTDNEVSVTENADNLRFSLPRQLSLTNSLFNFLEQMNAKSSVKVDIVNPSPLFGEISRKCPQFRHFQQQDSHELLRQLLDGIRQEEIKRQKKAILRHFELENVSPENVDEEMKKKCKAYGLYASHTITEKIFGGLLISTVLCEECKMSSQIFEPFMDLSLPLFEEKQENNDQLCGMLDGGKQANKPLRNRKSDWDSDENNYGEYVLSKPKNELGKPSKHQEKKQKQLAKKEKKKVKNQRNRKNSQNENSDASNNSQLPESIETNEDKVSDEEQKLVDNQSKEQSGKSGISNLYEDISSEELVDNQNEAKYEKNDPLNPCEGDVEGPDNLKQLINTHHGGKLEDEERNLSEPAAIIMNCEGNLKVCSEPEKMNVNSVVSIEVCSQTVDNVLEEEIPVSEKQNLKECLDHLKSVTELKEVEKSSKSNQNVSLDQISHAHRSEETKINGDEGLEVSYSQVKCETVLKEERQTDCKNNPKVCFEQATSHAYAHKSEEVQINGDLNPKLCTNLLKNATEPKFQMVGEANSKVSSQKELENLRCLFSSELKSFKEQKDKADGDGEPDSLDIEDIEIGVEFDRGKGSEKQTQSDNISPYHVPDQEDENHNLEGEFRNGFSTSEPDKSNLDDRIQALTLQIKDVRIRRDSDRQENLLNSSESADENESQRTNCTSPKSSIEDTCSNENGDNWSHSVSEQQTKEWILKSLTTLKPRNHISPHECSIDSCLSHFTKPELLTGNNKFRCENCTEMKIKKTGNKKDVVYSNASKQILVFSPPAILTLHLKRFQQVGMSLRKVNRFVEFPLILDLAPFCSSACVILPHMALVEDEILYSLYGIVEHSGRLTSGHYTAYVKASKRNINRTFECQVPLGQCNLEQLLHKYSGVGKSSFVDNSSSEITDESHQWFYISDSHVKEVSEAQVLKCQAYLLFYERIK